MSNSFTTNKSRALWRPAILALILLSVLMPIGLVLPQRAFAQAKSFHMDRYDTDVTVNADGTMDIVETLAYVFDQGTYRRGSRFIPLDRTESITNVSVEEVGVGLYSEGSYNED